jgi:hypothetical protein
MLLDFDRDVCGVSSQPFTLTRRAGYFEAGLRVVVGRLEASSACRAAGMGANARPAGWSSRATGRFRRCSTMPRSQPQRHRPPRDLKDLELQRPTGRALDYAPPGRDASPSGYTGSEEQGIDPRLGVDTRREHDSGSSALMLDVTPLTVVQVRCCHAGVVPTPISRCKQ